MTTIISDTSPINYLLLIGEIDVLPQLFQEVLIPPAVWRELQHKKTPRPVFEWAANLPAWAKVVTPLRIDPSLDLDEGETEAISLAMERNIHALLIDDRQGWKAAVARAIVPIGTVNVLEAADECNLLDFEQAIAKLRATNFRVEQSIVDAALDRVRRRKRSAP